MNLINTCTYLAIAVFFVIHQSLHVALFVFIVQSQYDFVYDVVLDDVTCGETAIPCSELRGLLTKLTKTDTGSLLDEQFKVSNDNLLTIMIISEQ